MKLNISDFKVVRPTETDIFEREISARMVEDAIPDSERINRYVNAILMLQEFLKNGRGKATYDNPELELSFHNVLVELYNDEFDKAEIEQFTEILNCFDGMMTIGSTSGNVSFSLLMENMYYNRQPQE